MKYGRCKWLSAALLAVDGNIGHSGRLEGVPLASGLHNRTKLRTEKRSRQA